MNIKGLHRLLFVIAVACASLPASAATIPGPLSWAAVTNVAIGNCTPACSGIISDGDRGINSASSNLTSTGSSPSTATAQVTLSSTSYTPVLRTFADSNGAAVEAFANGLQAYTNNGAARTISLDLALSATIVSAGSGINSAAANVAVFMLSELDTLYTGLGTQLEGNKSDLFGYDPNDTSDTAGDDARARLSIARAGTSSTTETVKGTISFFVETGQSFLVWAGLESKARSGGLSDANNTFLIDIVEANGDSVERSLLGVTSLDSVGAVPLPAGVWLFLSGIGVVAGLSRRRKISLAS